MGLHHVFDVIDYPGALHKTPPGREGNSALPHRANPGTARRLSPAASSSTARALTCTSGSMEDKVSRLAESTRISRYTRGIPQAPGNGMPSLPPQHAGGPNRRPNGGSQAMGLRIAGALTPRPPGEQTTPEPVVQRDSVTANWPSASSTDSALCARLSCGAAVAGRCG
jgi:hypothetical protein